MGSIVSRKIECDGQCGAVIDVTAVRGAASELALRVAEEHWLHFSVTGRTQTGSQRSRGVYVCPACPPRQAAENVLDQLAAWDPTRGA
jgi:hypothetical protein